VTAPVAAVAAVRWENGAPVIIDQRLLPGEVREWRLATVDELIEAIRELAVRGAPAIGIAAGYGIPLGLAEAALRDPAAARAEVDRLVGRIGAARPTAVNLSAALERVRAAVARAGDDVDAMRRAALEEAQAIHDEDRLACAAIGQVGRAYLAGRRRIMTHCNTGRLATGGDGTALSVVYALHAAGELDEVIACEARPLLQGSRLTAWELAASGVPHRLIADVAAGSAIASGLVEAVIVGCDRVAANGDTANKVGTYGLAVLAARHGIPMLVAGPLSTFDPGTPTGAEIVVEERSADEVRGFGGRLTAPPGAPVWNPAFDVTPAELITAFVTEAGILEPPFEASIANALAGQPMRAAPSATTRPQAGSRTA
jgi:methylthioribose-1-phosphate isomerase